MSELTEELEQLVDEAWSLCNRLYYRHHSDPRFERIFRKAKERENRRAERLVEHRETVYEEQQIAMAESLWRLDQMEAAK